MKIKLAILSSLLVLVCLVWIGRRHNDDWDALPEIKGPQVLQTDCSNLFQVFLPEEDSAGHQFPRQIPKEKWPESISNLRPCEVYRDFFGVTIVIGINVFDKPLLWLPGENYKGWAEEGYFVQCNQTSSAPRLIRGRINNSRIPTQFDGIYKIYIPEMTE